VDDKLTPEKGKVGKKGNKGEIIWLKYSGGSIGSRRVLEPEEAEKSKGDGPKKK